MKKQTPTKRNQNLVSPLRKRREIAHIKVVGIGGGGNKIVSRMMESGRIRGVEFIAINTDAQDLDYCSAHKKIYIGKALTRGLGAGMNPEIGKQAAEENRSEIGEALEGADIVFVTAGLGGGTGTPGSAVVSEIAREKGILTIAVVTKPFSFEGAQRQNIANEGLSRLKDKVDSLVVIPNDRVFSIINKDTPLIRAFGYIDDVLKSAVQVIAELINNPGLINVDFADIKTTLKDAGTTLIGIGVASGPDRSVKAVNAAINSPLIEIPMDGAKNMLFSVSGGRDMKMTEVHEIAKAISSNLDANARVIFGAYHDRNLKDKSIKVTVIATGFNGVYNRLSNMPSLFVNEERRAVMPTNAGGGHNDASKNQPAASKDNTKKVAVEEKNDSWEIPAFLRKRKR
jgi:cell division protein FtsZ